MAITAPPFTSEALGERMFEGLIATMELACIHVGDSLGLYAALDAAGPLTSDGLASAAGIDERYAREWLEQQAVAAVLVVDDVAAAERERRYTLPAGHREALLDPESLAYAASMARAVVGVLTPIEALIAAFRTGDGVPYPAYGHACREGIAAFNRPMFANLLTQEWLPAVPGLDAVLRSGEARVPTWAAGRGGRASPSPRGAPGCGSTGSTPTRPRWPRRGRWRTRAGWPTACASSRRTSARRSAGSTTS